MKNVIKEKKQKKECIILTYKNVSLAQIQVHEFFYIASYTIDYTTPFIGDVNFTKRVSIEVMHGICFC